MTQRMRLMGTHLVLGEVDRRLSDVLLGDGFDK